MLIQNIAISDSSNSENMSTIDTTQTSTSIEKIESSTDSSISSSVDSTENTSVDETNETSSTYEEVPTQPTVLLINQAHVQNIGWMTEESGNEVTIGTTGKNLGLEAIKLKIATNLTGSIIYKTHVRNIGWQSEVYDGQQAGTTGQNLSIEALSIHLTGQLAENFDIYYQLHVQNFGWLGWAKNGELAGSQGYAYHVEAVKLKIVPKDEKIQSTGLDAFRENTYISCQSHVRNIGWTPAVKNNEITGTVGRALAIEALKMNVVNTHMDGSIKYRAHVRNIGWQNWVDADQQAGTVGRALSIEAIQIELTGQLKDKYDVYYLAHVSSYGWLHWAKNGEVAGSTGLAYQLEALQIQLVPKNTVISGMSTVCHYIDASSINTKAIIDISAYQDPNVINYDQLSKSISGAIVRIHHGTAIIDSAYKKHIIELQKRGVPVAVYGWALGTNVDEMRRDAETLYNLAARYNPTFWWIDVEKQSMPNMRLGVEVFRQRLKELGAKKVGVYIANHEYKNFNIDTSKFDGIWIPAYGGNIGYFDPNNKYSLPSATNDYDIHQYTSVGRISGYNGNLDLSRIVRKGYPYFFE